MAEVLFRPAALTDLSSIWKYTLDTWGAGQAERYVRTTHGICAELAESPHLGRSCDYVRVGYRKHLVGRHVVYYVVKPGGRVEVARILHQSMDVERHI